MSSPKKKDNDPKTRQTKQAKVKEHAFTEIDFKFEVKEAETSLSALQKFIEAADKFPEDVNYDIVGQYVQSSEECAEIFKLLEEKRRKPQEIVSIFSALECIFIRLSEASGKLELIGDNIVHRILNYHMPVIYFSLGLNNKNQLIKKTLRLLTRMVAFSASSARAVQTELDFGHVNLLPLCQRRDIKDTQDVRTCFIQFIMAFLLIGDDIVVRQMVEQKVVIQKILQGIVSDKHENIHLILSTLLEKVVQNPTISKTAKIHLFTESILKHLSQLYSWQGPKHWKELKEKGTAKTPVKASPEEVDLVTQTVHTFLTELCCSFKTGINFYDNSLGTSGKNQNHILTGFLSSLQKSSPHPLSAELVISVLQACPDQLHHFLSSLAPSLNPRPSSGWVKNIDFLMKIYESQPEKLNFLSSKSLAPDMNYVSMALVYILPPDKVLSSFTWGLKQPCQLVRHTILEFLKLALQRTLNILASVQSVIEQDTVNTAVMRELQHKLKEAVLKKLPDGATLLSCWNKLGPDKSEKEQEAVKEDIPPVSSLQHMVRLEQVLCLYQELVPSLLSDNPNHVSSLLEGIRSVDVLDKEGKSNKGQMLPQLYLLNLLAGTDARQLPWGKENASKHTLMYLLLELIIKVVDNEQLYHITQHLVGKLLQSTGLFPGQDQELSLWLRQLHLSPCSSVVDFCARMLTTFISNPYPYMDRVADIIAESTVDCTDSEGSVTGRGDRMEEKTISDILAMDLKDNWDMSAPVEGREMRSTTSQSQSSLPFSPLTIVGLEMMNNEDKYRKDSDVVCFLTETMVDIFHTQVDPVPYTTLVSRIPCTGDYRQIGYIISWINTDKSWKASKHEKQSVHATRLMQALWHRAVDAKYMDSVMTSLRGADLQTLTLVAQQLLLYIHHTVSHMEKPDATKQFIETYFKILTHTVDVVITKASNERYHLEETDSDISSEFELLDSSRRSQQEILSDIINIIFQHPTLADAFHKPHLLDTTTDNGTSVHTLLTEFCTSLTHKLKDISVSTRVKKTFEPYADRILKALQKTHSNMDFSETPKLRQILKSLESLLPFLDPTLHHRSFLEQLLELPSNILVSKGKSKELGKAGQLVINLASKSLANMKDTAQGRQLLPLDKISTLLNLMTVSSDSFLDNFCLDLLEIQPAYALAVKKELCVYLFENVGQIEASMVDTLLYQNVVCRIWFEDWLQESVERVRENRKQYGDLVTCYVRLEGCRMSGRDSARQCLQTIEKLYLTDISQILTAEPTTVRVVCSLIQTNSIGDRKVSKMWKHLSTAISEEEESVLQCHMEMLVLLYHHGMSGHRTGTLFVVLVKVLIASAARKVGRDTDVEQYCLTTLTQILEEEETLKVTDNIVSIWLDFVKVCLKALYQDPRLLAVIENLVPLVYVKSHDVSPPIEMLYEMLMSHSQFMQVMLGEKGQEVKGQMVSLLLTLVELCPDCCHPDHHSVLQGAYGATLSQTDQKLLKIMFLYEKNGKGLSDARPFLWGPKAVEHYALRKSLASSLLKQPSIEQIVEAFNPRRMYKSSLHFPIGRQLTPEVVMKHEEHQSTADMYDPCFVLPLFCGLLSSDCLVDCRRFVSSHCLAYALSALSSHAPGVRKAAYTVLTRYFDHLATVKFHERLQVTYLLDTLRNSVQQANERLSCLITLFLARVSRLLLHPDEHMYRQMNNFLLLKPSLDTMNVPEFYKLFNSADLQHKVERSWILNLLSDGLREMADYKIMERRFTFKLLQSFYDSAMSDQYSQTRVLKIVKAACSGRAMAVDLAKNHGLLTWISGAILKDAFDKVRGDLLTSILHCLWFSMLGDGETQRNLPVQFVRETLLCCKRLLTYIRHQKFSGTALLFLTETMVSALNSEPNSEPTQNKEQNLSSSTEVVTVKEVMLLMYSCCQLQQDTLTAAQVAAILRKVGVNIQMSKRPVEKGKKWSRNDEDEELFEEDEKMEEEHGEENVEKKTNESEQMDEKEKSADGQKVDSDRDNVVKILNRVCAICLHWKPRDVGTHSVHQNTKSSTQRVHPLLSGEDVHLSGALVTMSWLLSHLYEVDSSESKTQILSWVCGLVLGSDQFSKVSRMMVLDSSDFAFKFLSSLCSAYNCLLNKTTPRATGSSVSDESRHRDDLVSALTVLNTIVLCLLDQQCTSAPPDQTHSKFVSALQSAKILHKDHVLISQEKTSLLLREWLLGSWSAGQFRLVSEKTGHLTQSPNTDQVMDQKTVSPKKHRKRKSGVIRGDEGSSKPSPSAKTKKRKK